MELSSEDLSPYSCPICYEFYDEEECSPVSFPCGHSCCLHHTRYIQKCHACRAAIPLPEELVTNYALRDCAILITKLKGHIKNEDKPVTKKAILDQNISTTTVRMVETVVCADGGRKDILKKGILQVRYVESGQNIWADCYFILTGFELSQLIAAPEKGMGHVIDTYRIRPSSSVFETNLGPYAFELVTQEKVLHVMGKSELVTESWISSLRDTILCSMPDPFDILYHAALQIAKTDYFYDVTFRDDSPLGVVLERTGEWALVKAAHAETGVCIGSALISIDDENVTSLPYHETIEKLKNWKPPLKLGFRKVLRKQGYLYKQFNTNINCFSKLLFTLDNGFLTFTTTNIIEPFRKYEIPLMGSAVSLISDDVEVEVVGRPFCFRFVNAMENIILSASDNEDLMDWAARMYHAIAIANGSSHIINI
eukprot:gene1056-2066_t